MIEITDFGGQNWLIMPAARAVNEAAPTCLYRVGYTITLTGRIVFTQSVIQQAGVRPDRHGARLPALSAAIMR